MHAEQHAVPDHHRRGLRDARVGRQAKWRERRRHDEQHVERGDEDAPKPHCRDERKEDRVVVLANARLQIDAVMVEAGHAFAAVIAVARARVVRRVARAVVAEFQAVLHGLRVRAAIGVDRVVERHEAPARDRNCEQRARRRVPGPVHARHVQRVVRRAEEEERHDRGHVRAVEGRFQAPMARKRVRALLHRGIRWRCHVWPAPG
mmetsp:Transcript_3336/g.10409  ORF Transcript_3336/g.10409 Transcript_3336/m.10409 type:complete len:205 (-) Transcript_3336:69-683(-)